MKSFMALQLSAAISSGDTQFLGFPILTNGPVAYIQIDTSASVWFERVKDQAALGADFANVAFADSDTGTPYPLNILKDAPTIKQHLDTIKPIMVVWDTIREMHPGDENQSDVMKNVVSAMVSCTRGEDWSAANLIISHRKKENQNYEDDLMNANRGSSYIAGRCDALISLGKGAMEFQSRTHPYTRKPVKFNEENCLWELDSAEQHLLSEIANTLEHCAGESVRKQGEHLGPRLNITADAARMLITRRGKMFQKGTKQ